MNSEKETRVILTREDLINGLKKCGVAEGQNIMVHISLKKLGFVVGGAETVIRALIDIV